MYLFNVAKFMQNQEKLSIIIIYISAH